MRWMTRKLRVGGRGGGRTGASNNSVMMPVSWLQISRDGVRSLHLHKYTRTFEVISWKEMIKLYRAALIAKVVSALRARSKMLMGCSMIL